MRGWPSCFPVTTPMVVAYFTSEFKFNSIILDELLHLKMKWGHFQTWYLSCAFRSVHLRFICPWVFCNHLGVHRNVCTYDCVYTWLCALLIVCTYGCVYIWLFVHMAVCTYVYDCVYLWLCVHMIVCTYDCVSMRSRSVYPVNVPGRTETGWQYEYLLWNTQLHRPGDATRRGLWYGQGGGNGEWGSRKFPASAVACSSLNLVEPIL